MAKRWLTGALVALLVLPAWLFAAPRVITLSPANTELAFAAGITPVAVSAYSDYPDAARQLEQVANWQGMNVERIAALKPDLLVAWRGGNPERQINQLKSLGIHVLWLDPQNVAQVAERECASMLQVARRQHGIAPVGKGTGRGARAGTALASAHRAL
ncbi:Vitamin B12 ABC transporter, B12-binding component BtuF [Cronobacter sakazakii 696]|nr:Vitamin B12 ABC transporter, B12-binding component BtuF [Cronobacter sakazakii 696]